MTVTWLVPGIAPVGLRLWRTAATGRTSKGSSTPRGFLSAIGSCFNGALSGQFIGNLGFETVFIGSGICLLCFSIWRIFYKNHAVLVEVATFEDNKSFYGGHVRCYGEESSHLAGSIWRGDPFGPVVVPDFGAASSIMETTA